MKWRMGVVALGMLVVSSGGVTPAAADCVFDFCGGFAQLRTDINTYVLPVNQQSLLVKADLAQQAAPGDPCRSFLQLSALDNEVSGLGLGGRISLFGVQTIHSDVISIQRSDPCKA